MLKIIKAETEHIAIAAPGRIIRVQLEPDGDVRVWATLDSENEYPVNIKAGDAIDASVEHDCTQVLIPTDISI